MRRIFKPRKTPRLRRGDFSGVAYEDFGGMGFLDFNKLMSDAQRSLQTGATNLINKEVQKLTGTTPQPQVQFVTGQQLPQQILMMDQGPTWFDRNKQIVYIAGGSIAALLLGLIVYKAVKK